MLRICVCTHRSLKNRYCGADSRILNFAKSLSNEGATVYLVDRSISRSISSLVIDDDKYYVVKKGELKENQYPLFVRFLLPGLIKRMQIVLLFLLNPIPGFAEGWGYISNAFDLQLMVKLLFVCKREKADIIQSEFPVPMIPSFLVKRILGIPLVFDAHNIESLRIQRMGGNRLLITCLEKLEKLCCRLSDAIFVVSNVDKDVLLNWGVSSEKITVIPNSVDTNVFSPKVDGEKIRRKYQLQNFTLMFHGLLNYPPNREAVDILVNRILPSVLDRHPNTRLLLVGKNPPKVPHPNVIVTGFVKDLPQHIAAADVGVVPLLKGGGTRIKVLEYMACGKPVVSTEIGAEGITVGGDILIAKSLNSDFIDLICRLLQDKTLGEKLGDNARKKVEVYYSWTKSARRAISIHRYLASKGQVIITLDR